MRAALWILGIIVVIGLLVGGWFGFWALAQANQNAQYGVNTHGQQYQSALIAQERDKVTALTVATDAGQKTLITNQFCSLYETLTQPPADLVSAHATLCY